ncbi:hypothetical protein PBI_STROKESEAT_40 [Mycobacterium phage Strokeseat]|nr:hypothetical protein PBI_STROKESEAT_40 [Mycobacterium phage Strokeseat]
MDEWYGDGGVQVDRVVRVVTDNTAPGFPRSLQV